VLLPRFAEIENHLQIADATVAEFIVELANQAKGNVDVFKKVSAMHASLWRP
jgi:ATP-dependent RNA helicase DHX8/PRP22